MRKTKRTGNFFLCLIINLLLNFEGIIPAVILLVLHFVLKWSFWWSVAAFGIWFLWLILWTCVIGWAGRCGSTPDLPKENKNPYSANRQ